MSHRRIHYAFIIQRIKKLNNRQYKEWQNVYLVRTDVVFLAGVGGIRVAVMEHSLFKRMLRVKQVCSISCSDLRGHHEGLRQESDGLTEPLRLVFRLHFSWPGLRGEAVIRVVGGPGWFSLPWACPAWQILLYVCSCFAIWCYLKTLKGVPTPHFFSYPTHGLLDSYIMGCWLSGGLSSRSSLDPFTYFNSGCAVPQYEFLSLSHFSCSASSRLVLLQKHLHRYQHNLFQMLPVSQEV